MKPAILLLLLSVAIAFGAPDNPSMEPTDGFSPMLFGYLIIGIGIMMFLVGVGIVAATITAACTAILVTLGILSSAALFGVLRHRFSSGLRALHYQLCAVAALPVGVCALWLGSHLFSADLSLRDILVIGSLAGICSGLLLALAFDRLAILAYRRLAPRTIPNTSGNV